MTTTGTTEKRGNGRLKSNVMTAYERIRQKILSCEYAPGQLISEKEIIEELGLTRTPVREAVGMLFGEGLLEIIPKKGLQVPLLSIKRLRESYSLRMLLESEAVRQAVPYLEDADVEHLRLLDKRLSGSLQEGKDAFEVFGVGSDVHLNIAALSRNETLYSHIRQLRDECHRGYVYYFQQKLDLLRYKGQANPQKELLDSIVACHAKFIDCLEERDAEGAIHYIREDLTGMIKLLTEL